MMPFHKSYGRSILLRLKDTLVSTTSFPRTINLPSFWRSSKKTKHTKNRFFLIKDKIVQSESDVLTKPKQGKAFRVFHGQLMIVQEDYDAKVEHLNTHPNLLLPADDEDQILAKNNAVLVKALKQ